MRKKTIRNSAFVLAVAVSVQAIFTGTPLHVKAADESSDATYKKDTSEPYYYDLADGDYYLAGTAIQVNGENKSSGDVLNAPGEYRIQRTSTDGRTLEQEVVLYRRGDTYPDGQLNSRDIVALKKYQGGEELSRAGLAAVELSDDPFVNSADSVIMRQLLVGDETVVGDGDWKNYPSANTSLAYKGENGDAVMPIGGFAGPALDETTSYPDGALSDTRKDEIYKLISDASINLITTTPNKLDEDTSVEDVMRVELALAEKYGINMYVNLSYLNQKENQTETLVDQYLNEYSSYASFQGITLGDEPIGTNYATDFGNPGMDTYSAVGQLLHQYTNLTGYTNLLPWWDEHGTEEQYKVYLEEYVKAYNPKQISLDYYVWGDRERGSNASKEAYFKNLAMIKEAADKADIPFWIICQAGGYFIEERKYVRASDYYPTEGETLWNVNTALAYGAQGITYYPLVQPSEYTLSKSWYIGQDRNDYMRNGLIGANGNPTGFYEYAKRANTQILAVDHVLMQAQNEGIMVPAGSTAASEVGTTIANYKELQSVTSSGTAGAIVGCFDYLGTTALYVVNYDADAEQTIALNFDKDYNLAITRDAVTNAVATTGKLYEVTLTAGEGALILVNDPKVTDNAEINSVCAAIDALPELIVSEMPRDYTNVLSAKDAYDNLNVVERAQIPESQKAKLQALYDTTTNYGIVYNEAVAGGIRDCDSVYGNVTVINATGVTTFADNLVRENINSQYGDVVFYVYNPTGTNVTATYGNATCMLKANAWTKMTVAATNFVSDNNLTFASPISGQWKITDYYGLNNGDLLERVVTMIESLPEPMLTRLSDKEAVTNARAMYEALPVDSKASVTNYQKLLDCEERIEILEAEAAGKLPVVIDVAERAYGIDNESDTYIMDETHGTVMGFADATYFAIHKDQMTDAYKAARMAVIYIYNPTDAKAYVRTQLGDNGWVKSNYVTLYPEQWNRVELFNRGRTHTFGDVSFVENYLTAGETIYIYAVDETGAASTYADEGWKVSSVYGINEYNLTNVKDCDVVLDISKTQLGGTGTDGTIAENTAFGTVWSFTNATSFSLAKEQKSNIFKLCKDVATYIYNPTDTAVIMSITTDWNYYEYFQLMPKSWNRILISDFIPQEGKNLISTTNTIWFDAKSGNNTFPASSAGEKWMISNFYGVPIIPEAITNVEVMLKALKTAEEITSLDDTETIKAVQAARIAYDALSESYKELIGAELVVRLEACEAKIEELEAEANMSLADKIAKKIILDASIPNMTFLRDNGNGTVTTSTEKNDVLGKVAILPADTDVMSIEPSRQSEAYKNATKVSFWVYNPTNTDATLYYTMDWAKNVYATLRSQAWTRVDVDNTSVDAFLTGEKTVYYYINNGASVGVEGWKISSFYGNLSESEIKEVENSFLPLAERIANQIILDASIPNMTLLNSSSEAVVTTPTENALLGTVAQLPTEAAVLAIEPSRQSESYKKATKLSFWVYNPTDTSVTGYYTMDWAKNVNVTLEGKAWTRIDIDDTSVDAFLTSEKTIYYYINNNSPVGAEGWLISSFYAELSAEDVFAIEAELAQQTVTIADSIAEKIILDASIPNMTFLKNNGGGTVTTTTEKNDVLGKVAVLPADTDVMSIEPSRQTENYKNATKLSFWVYNPTNTDATLYYTMDWTKNVYVTLTSQAWTRVDVDNMSVDTFLTGEKTVYYYINNGASVGENGWKISSFYGNLSEEEMMKVENGLTPFLERINDKIILDASIPNMTLLNSSGGTVATTPTENVLLGTVVQLPTEAAVLAIEPSRQSESYKKATKLSFWVYNPTDTSVTGYYTMDWAKNVNVTLEGKSWTRIDVDDTSVDAFLTSEKTIYYYINNNSPVGAEGWFISSFYGDLTEKEISEVSKNLK